MPSRADDRCPEPACPPRGPTEPHAPAIHVSSVYRCADPQQAEALLAGELEGFVYSRDGNPNAQMLAEKCRQLHEAPCAAVAASGMAAMALAVLSQLQQGDHVVVSSHLYGANLELLTSDAARLGIETTTVDATDIDATRSALRRETRLVVVESISNPCLRVADLAALAELVEGRETLLLVDNTLASPIVCRPMNFGADLVLESLTKIMSGHSDVVLGLLCGNEEHWQRVPKVLSRWGLASSPFDCWLSLRGIGTLSLRASRASDNALHVAEFLKSQPAVAAVHYPGLAEHPDHPLAARQLDGRFGSLVTFTLAGGRAAAEAFIARAEHIPFCPSLGELSTTLSHPESTSHRSLTAQQRAELGIHGGTIRLSVGIESAEAVVEVVCAGLAGIT